MWLHKTAEHIYPPSTDEVGDRLAGSRPDYLAVSYFDLETGITSLLHSDGNSLPTI